ncbi:MAG: hypothetical protein JW832_10770 [Deltaproteobacteria bacterium]|nr:hypothetical protein [Deltaproteobacteria bacterium]
MMTDGEIDKGLLILRVIWCAMLASLAIYVFAGLQVAANMQVSINQDKLDMLRKIFYALAGVTLIITRYVRRFILSAGGRAGPAAQSSESPVLQKYATAMIIAWALSESIGIYGLVLFLLGKNATDLYLLILIAAAALLLHRPARDEIMSLAESSTAGGTAA